MEEKTKLLVLTMQKNSSTFQVKPRYITPTIDKVTQERGTSTAKRRSNCLSRSRKGLTRTVLSCKARVRREEQLCPTIQRADNKTQCLTQSLSETLKIASKSAIQWRKRMIRARTMYMHEAYCRARFSRLRIKICQLRVPNRAMEVFKYKVREICSQIGST